MAITQADTGRSAFLVLSIVSRLVAWFVTFKQILDCSQIQAEHRNEAYYPPLLKIVSLEDHV